MTERPEPPAVTDDRPAGGEATSEHAVAVTDDLTRTYGGVPVLDSVSITVEPGLTAVIGPNGSGKSTLLGALAGTIAPTAGEIRHPGVDRTDGNGKPIGYLPQRVPFREGFTARETLAFYARLVEADPDARLASVGLTDAAEKPVEALSGGMKRLLGIAQATLGDPSLVVLDEPTSGLDPGMRERAFRAIADQTTGDAGIVVSTHDLDLVDAHADRVVLLARGRVIAAGDLDALCDDRGVDTTAELYDAAVDDASGSGDTEDASRDDNDVHVTGVSER
jgi:ABC-type multidrug transport system ATPase subunit